MFYYRNMEQCDWNTLQQVLDLYTRKNIQVRRNKVFHMSFFEYSARCRPCNSELSSCCQSNAFSSSGKRKLICVKDKNIRSTRQSWLWFHSLHLGEDRFNLSPLEDCQTCNLLITKASTDHTSHPYSRIEACFSWGGPADQWSRRTWVLDIHFQFINQLNSVDLFSA